MKPDLIIGYGSTLRRDDGVGYVLAEKIAGEAWPAVQSLAVHQLTPELTALLAQAKRVIFMDAQAQWQAGDPLVTLTSLDIAPQYRSLEHHCGPGYLLALTHGLYQHRPQAWLLAIAAVDFSFGEELSPLTQQAQDAAKQQLRKLLGLQDY